MEILAHARELVYQLLEAMPTPYQRQSLNAFLELFLKAQGSPLPEHSGLKSASALSRFLNYYCWSVRGVIRQVRRTLQEQLRQYQPRGRRPHLQVILDLTSLEKRGKFKPFESLVSVFNGKRGVHLVVLYLVVGPWRIPWSLRVYRGKGNCSPAELGLKLVRQLPGWLRRRFELMVLADSAFGSVDFLRGIRQLKLHAITGVRYDRRLQDGRQLFHLHKPEQHLQDAANCSIYTNLDSRCGWSDLIGQLPWPGFISSVMDNSSAPSAMLSPPKLSKPARLSGGGGIVGR